MADEGATPAEQIMEACRRNNPDLLLEVLNELTPTSPASSHEDAVANLLNSARDPMGNAALHVAAAAGSYETLDILLDQPGVETDPLTRLTHDTPLHSAVSYLNSQPPPPPTEPPDLSIIDILLDAGCDPRIRNKARRKPVECVDPRNEALRGVLRRAEVMVAEGQGVVEGLGVGEVEGVDGGEGSESD